MGESGLPPPRPNVLVTRALPAQVLARLDAVAHVTVHPADEAMGAADFRAALAQADVAVISLTDVIDDALLAAAPRLQAVCTVSVGTNHIDLAACARRGIWCTHTPDVLTDSTADLAMTLMMAATRRVGEAERYLRAGKWKGFSSELLAVADVYRSTLGVVGLGRIGQAIARRAFRGFEMPVLYHQRRPAPPEVEAACGARYASLDELLRCADHVVLVLPYSAETHHLIGANELARMKPTATLTNVARGGVVDDAALADALKRRIIAAAALDVYEGEPEVHPALLTCPTAVLVPHIGSATVGTRTAMAQLAVDNALAVIRGEAPPTPVQARHGGLRTS